MRIVQISPWFHPHMGGVESHVYSISSELVKRGHEIEILTSRHRRDIPERETMDGFTVTRLKPFTVMLRTPVVPRIKAALRTRDVDVFHAHSPPPLAAYYTSKISKEKRVPFLLTYHCDIEIPSIFGQVIEILFRRTLGARTMRRVDNIIVTTETYAATSRVVWRYTPVVIPNPVDFDMFNPDVDGRPLRKKLGLSPEESIVLCVGRVVPHKGLEYLVEAAQYIEGVKIVVVGEGPHLGAINRLARSFGVEGKIIFQSGVSRTELTEYYALSDVFVLPSVSRLEAFGIVALEAMSSGKPVVVSDMPGMREVISNGVEGLLCDPLNAEDLGEKIKTLIEDGELRRRMGMAGRQKVVERFGIKSVVDQLESVYEQLIELREKPEWRIAVS